MDSQIQELEKRIEVVENVSNLSFADRIKRVIFNKRSSVDPATITQSYSVSGGSVTSPKTADALLEIVVNGKRYLLPTYYG